ncbi:MAG: hexokinase family protein [Methylococcales bacterium]
MEVDLQKLNLTLEQLFDIRNTLYQKILDGLACHGQEIKVLPAYLRRPFNTLPDDAVVLDVGGTNIRAARLRCQGSNSELLTSPVSDRETMQQAKTPGQVNAHQFFAKQAALIAQVCSEPMIKLGYCFSYPTEIKPDGDALLLKWTKGVSIDNVVGRSVREQLQAALREKDKQVVKLPVLNDTVASLLAGAWLAPECTHYIGLIVGTGTNMAGFFPVQRITKLAPKEHSGWHDDDEMAVNLESGNFTPPHLTAYDDMLDSAKPDDYPGEQRFEKAVSGAYLPRLFGYVVGRKTCLQLQNSFDPEDPDAHPGLIANLRDYPGLVGEAATAVLNRSADLVAAAIAGFIQAYEPAQKQVGILAEGTMFWQTPGYCQRVKKTLAHLVTSGTTTKILQCPSDVDANFLGAACAALS